MDYRLNRETTSKDYTDNNEDYCINEHSSGNYQFTENYVRFLEANYVKNNKKSIK